MRLKNNSQHKIAWGITGAGHFLPESVDLLQKLNNVDLFLSKAAEEVLKSYRLNERLEGLTVFYDRAASSPPVTRLYTGKYKAVVVAPATSNSVAKFVLGISDNIVTNLFAHAGKTNVPAIVLPCDVEGDLDSQAPGGMVKVYPRDIDLDNIRRLAEFAGVTVVADIRELEKCLNTYL